MTGGLPAKSGDVIFVNEPGKLSEILCELQRRLDPNAKQAALSFGHVAVAVDSILALEAYPEEQLPAGVRPILGDTTEIGKWSKSELFAGVRLKPIADIVIPAVREGALLAVLRSPDPDGGTTDNRVTPFHPEVLRLLGSEYSIEEFKAKIPRVVMQSLEKVAGAKFAWKSTPDDFATRIGIDQELRRQVEALIPNFAMPAAARTFFCSQLIIECLIATNLLDAGPIWDGVTPSGLFKLLAERKWVEVTERYLCAPDTRYYHDMSPQTCAVGYAHTLHLTALARDQDVVRTQAEILDAAMRSASDFLKRQMRG
jgi:hypothetical protein